MWTKERNKKLGESRCGGVSAAVSQVIRQSAANQPQHLTFVRYVCAVLSAFDFPFPMALV